MYNYNFMITFNVECVVLKYLNHNRSLERNFLSLGHVTVELSMFLGIKQKELLIKISGIIIIKISMSFYLELLVVHI